MVLHAANRSCGTGQLVRLLCGMIATLSVSVGVATEQLAAIHGVGIDRGITRIICTSGDRQGWRRSRAVIIDVGVAQQFREVLLAPAHGLPQSPEEIKDNCIVADAAGEAMAISEVWFSENRGESLDGDWAVLTTDRMVAADIDRQQLIKLDEALGDDAQRDQIPVRLLLYSQSVDQDCRIISESPARLAALTSELFFHSCRAWRGVSGAPIVVGIDGRPTIIGFHIAKLEHPLGVALHGIEGIGRAVDASIFSAVWAAAVHAQEPVERSNRRRQRVR